MAILSNCNKYPTTAALTTPWKCYTLFVNISSQVRLSLTSSNFLGSIIEFMIL